MRLAPPLFAASLALALAAPAHADEWQRSFSVSGPASLGIDAKEGRVTVTTWDKPEIAIHVTSSGWNLTTQVKLDAQQNGSRVELTTQMPHFTVNVFPFTPHWLHIEVSVPKHCDVDVRTGDGAVTLEGLEGHSTVNTSDGHVTITGLKGDVELRTSDGGIEARGVDGRLKAASGDGHISVSGRFDALELSTSDGRISAEAQLGSSIGDGWNLDTSDGGITLRIPSDLKADLEASTGDGGITVDIPVEVHGDWHASRRLSGTINGGGHPLRLRTADGSIRIERM
jgi:DUF4097 and DUF4098 domain-containing protein YvlB